MTGGMVSTTETKLVQNEELPQQSVAIQMAVMMFRHGPAVFVVTLNSEMVTLVPQQTSKAVGGL